MGEAWVTTDKVGGHGRQIRLAEPVSAQFDELGGLEEAGG